MEPKQTPAPDIAAFDYHLPEHRIARHPASRRDASKLLVWNNGHISHWSFDSIIKHVPADAVMVFNNTRVIPARIHFRKVTGALIEIFLLEPVAPSTDPATVMQDTAPCTWRCLIGNRKRWKAGETLQHNLPVQGSDLNRLEAKPGPEADTVVFTWPGKQTFAEVIESAGATPLPPYIKRKAVPEDRERYQTVYSKIEGAVAAPTAGLHFTDDILGSLRSTGIGIEYVTLHVGAGTFKPVTTADYRKHDMHAEKIEVTKSSLAALNDHQGPVISVGTTSMRILESLFWIGVKIGHKLTDPLHIESDIPYRFRGSSLPHRQRSLDSILEHLEKEGLDKISASTGIYIYPGYHFRMCQGLVTNFHLPRSTLLLLVSAFTNNDWKRIYREALDRDYRFLSYGDASFLYRG